MLEKGRAPRDLFARLLGSSLSESQGIYILEKGRAPRVLFACLLGSSLSQGIYFRKGSRSARFVRSPTQLRTQAPPDERFALKVLILFAPLTILGVPLWF